MDNKANKFLIIGAVVAIVTSGKDYSSPDDAQMYNTEDGMTITDEDGNEYEISDWTEVGETEYED